MLSDLRTTSYNRPATPIDPTYIKLDSVEGAENGQIVRKSQFRKFDPNEVLGQFTSNDFSLSTLQALGKPLASVTMSINSSMDYADSIAKVEIPQPHETN